MTELLRITVRFFTLTWFYLLIFVGIELLFWTEARFDFLSLGQYKGWMVVGAFATVVACLLAASIWLVFRALFGFKRRLEYIHYSLPLEWYALVSGVGLGIETKAAKDQANAVAGSAVKDFWLD